MQFKLTDMNKTYYAVRKGYNIGVYNTWDECKQQIHKYSGAEYKKFNNYQEALDFISGKERNNDLTDINTTNYYKVYTDGSCDRDNKLYSYGIVVINPQDFVIARIYQGYRDDEYSQFANVAGECFGVIKALEYCEKNGIKNIIIYHDYLGVANWANYVWQCNTAISKYYLNQIENYRKTLNFKFIWVRGHQGNHYNEEADNLAKIGLHTYEQSFL